MYCTFHCTLSRFNFHVSLYLLLIARKQTMLIKRFNFVFIKVPPSVSQTNAQAVTGENEEQYTLSNIIYIKLLPFFFEFYFEGGAPKMYTNQLINGVDYFYKIAG